MRKFDIVNLLNAKHGYRRFLEISTMSTGCAFGEIVEAGLERCHRLAYNWPAGHDDGFPAHYVTTQPFAHELIDAMLAFGDGAPAFDSIFVDPYHSYACSITDIYGAYALLEPGGMLAVHDCAPTDPAIMSPERVPGAWCGVTWAAFVDFTFAHPEATSYTVDTDFGVGIVYKPAANVPASLHLHDRSRDELRFRWECARADIERGRQFYFHHRERLLNLVSVRTFADLEGLAIEEPTL